MPDGRITNGRPPGHSGYALSGTKKPARTSSKILKDLFGLIDASNMPAGALADCVGCHKVTLSRWKHGEATPTILDVEALAQVLGYELVLQRRE